MMSSGKQTNYAETSAWRSLVREVAIQRTYRISCVYDLFRALHLIRVSGNHTDILGILFYHKSSDVVLIVAHKISSAST